MGGKNQSEPQSSQILADIGKQLFNETDPLRTGLIDRSQSFLDNGLQGPQFDVLKNAVESQYANAKNNIIGSTPAGGALTSQIANLEQGKANTLTQGIGDLYNQETNRAMSLATGAPLQGGIGSLSGAGNIQAQIAMANANQNASAKTGIGFGLGSYLGGK